MPTLNEICTDLKLYSEELKTFWKKLCETKINTPFFQKERSKIESISPGEIEKIEHFQDYDCRSTFRIGFFGEQACGKSTFVNELLQKEIVPSGADRMTFVPTKIHFGDEDSISFYYYTQKEIKDVIEPYYEHYYKDARVEEILERYYHNTPEAPLPKVTMEMLRNIKDFNSLRKLNQDTLRVMHHVIGTICGDFGKAEEFVHLVYAIQTPSLSSKLSSNKERSSRFVEFNCAQELKSLRQEFLVGDNNNFPHRNTQAEKIYEASLVHHIHQNVRTNPENAFQEANYPIEYVDFPGVDAVTTQVRYASLFFLKEVDALVLLVDAIKGLSSEAKNILTTLKGCRRKNDLNDSLFITINKYDTLSNDIGNPMNNIGFVIGTIRNSIQNIIGKTKFDIYVISAGIAESFREIRQFLPKKSELDFSERLDQQEFLQKIQEINSDDFESKIKNPNLLLLESEQSYLLAERNKNKNQVAIHEEKKESLEKIKLSPYSLKDNVDNLVRMLSNFFTAQKNPNTCEDIEINEQIQNLTNPTNLGGVPFVREEIEHYLKNTSLEVKKTYLSETLFSFLKEIQSIFNPIQEEISLEWKNYDRSQHSRIQNEILEKLKLAQSNLKNALYDIRDYTIPLQEFRIAVETELSNIPLEEFYIESKKEILAAPAMEEMEKEWDRLSNRDRYLHLQGKLQNKLNTIIHKHLILKHDTELEEALKPLMPILTLLFETPNKEPEREIAVKILFLWNMHKELLKIRIYEIIAEKPIQNIPPINLQAEPLKCSVKRMKNFFIEKLTKRLTNCSQIWCYPMYCFQEVEKNLEQMKNQWTNRGPEFSDFWFEAISKTTFEENLLRQNYEEITRLNKDLEELQNKWHKLNTKLEEAHY